MCSLKSNRWTLNECTLECQIPLSQIFWLKWHWWHRYVGDKNGQIGHQNLKTSFLGKYNFFGTHKYCNKTTVHRWNVNHHHHSFCVVARIRKEGILSGVPSVYKLSHDKSWSRWGKINSRFVVSLNIERNTSTCIYIQSPNPVIFSLILSCVEPHKQLEHPRPL